MRTISNEERLAFLAKVRQQKSQPVTEKIDPLSQRVVEDEAAKGGKRKKKPKVGRITLPIPNKGESSATRGDTEEVVQPSPKKRKGPTTLKGRDIPRLA
ncbi:hypothetical protein A2U01_0068742, partial [Trifolium medium]|nr:hypothetical protein [Trifolium medium]